MQVKSTNHFQKKGVPNYNQSKAREQVKYNNRTTTFTVDEERFPGWDMFKMAETYRIVEEIFESMSEQAVLELFNNTDQDGLNNIYDIMCEEVYYTLYGQKEYNKGKAIVSDTFGYLEKLTASIDETLRCENLVYFITSCIPSFELNLHHLQWCEIYQRVNRFAIIASRDHGKSFLFSNAIPIWNLYKFRGKRPELRNNHWRNNPRGFLFSFSISQAVDLLDILKDTIESNDVLRERLYNKDKWNKTDITCLNKARITVKGFGSSVRGAHPGWVVVDDPLKDNALSSKEQRTKGINYFHAVIMNMIVPGGPVAVVGCVKGDTWIITERGIEKILKLSPKDIDLKKKGLYDSEIKLFGINNDFNKSSKYFVNGITDTLKIKTNSDYELECSKIHPIMNVDLEGNVDWVKSNKLRINDFILIKTKIENIGNRIKIKGEFNFTPRSKTQNRFLYPEYVNKELGYLIGLIIAEGSFDKEKETGFGISATEKEIIDYLNNNDFGLKFRLKPSNNNYVCGCKEFMYFMKWLGTKFVNAPQKEVPYKLMQSDKDTVTGFLQGLFDGDGGSSKKNGSPGVSSTSEELMKQVKLLLLHYFGIHSSIKKSKPGISKRAKGKYCCFSLCILEKNSINKFYEEIGFRLKRKNDNKKFIKSGKGFNLIPNVSKLILNLNKINNKHDLKIYKVRDSIQVGVDLVEKIIKYYENICPDDKNYVKLNKLYQLSLQGYRWEKIISIENNRSYTYDFVVPNTNSFISNGIVSHNTPFHQMDLYGDLKQKKGWKVFEFPAIYADGTLLWEGRWNFEGLMEKRESQGSLIFSREILCKPITNDSTIFPIDILNNAVYGMQKYTLVNNINNFPVKFDRVVVGCDFSISANVAADYCVFTVFGVDGNDRMWLLKLYRMKGVSYHEQMTILSNINREFKPDIFVMEDNVFQEIYSQEAQRLGIPAQGNTTTSKKTDLKDGWPGLAIFFEQGKFKIPTGNIESENVKDMLFSEFMSITYTDKGLQSTSEHDDIVSAIYHATSGLKLLTTGSMNFGFDFA